jgi:aryl-alcohol dehydrogenase-like predicted oxidoreductase
MFRHKPAEHFFAIARERRIGILARVPLASGLLTGKLSAASQFAPSDHRAYNRQGARFDAGETFSGIDFETGLAVVEEVRALVPDGATMAQVALRWILMFPEVTAAIPGARTALQAVDNTRAIELPPLSEALLAKVRDIYDRSIRAAVQDRW